MGTVLAFAVLGEEPSVWDVGAVGVVMGLVLVAYDRKDMPPHPLIGRMRRAFSLKDLPTRDRREGMGKEKGADLL